VIFRYGVFGYRVLSYRVLSGASLTTLYGRFNRFSEFLGDFRSRQGCFQFIWFNITVIGVFGLRIGFYGRASEASLSARKLYAVRFAFYSQ